MALEKHFFRDRLKHNLWPIKIVVQPQAQPPKVDILLEALTAAQVESSEMDAARLTEDKRSKPGVLSG